MNERVQVMPGIPVTVLTGFLGSGKTTLLRHLLAHPDMEETAVIVNEFGAVGLDHHLLESSNEDTLLLDNGCLCCGLRGDLVETLLSLLERRERGEVPAFRRGVSETTGLADPTPILQALMTEGATPRSSGELPWRTSFGAGLHLLRHQRNDEVLAELARVYVRDALARWAPSARLIALEVTREDASLVLRLRVRDKSTGAEARAEVRP